jgi:hypothetical protein
VDVSNPDGSIPFLESGRPSWTKFG